MRFFNRMLGPTLFPSVIWHTSEPSVHLTFDDGPHPVATPAVLDILGSRKITATFFLVGSNATRYADLVHQIVAEGHAVGNHSHTHKSLLLRPRMVQRQEIVSADEAIKDLVGKQPRHFRPPYGYFDHNTLSVARETQHTVVMWDVDSRDFATLPASTIVERTAARTRRGSVILLHDSDATASRIPALLNRLLDRLQGRGFQFEPLPA